jgi:hypothetical protein
LTVRSWPLSSVIAKIKSEIAQFDCEPVFSNEEMSLKSFGNRR